MASKNPNDDGPKLREEKEFEDFYPLLGETDLIPLIFDKTCLENFHADARDNTANKTGNTLQCKQIIFEGKITTEPLNIGNAVVDFHKPSIKVSDLTDDIVEIDSIAPAHNSKGHPDLLKSQSSSALQGGHFQIYESRIRHQHKVNKTFDISAIKKNSPGLKHFQIQYNMDEQDCLFLDYLKQSYNDFEITELQFEGLVSILEYQWAYMQKHFPIPSPPVVYLDQLCSVCNTEETLTNTIIFCDSCNLAVHQECYGILFIPPGPWLCRSCAQRSTTLTRPYCCVCPEIGGPLKQTTCGTWAHVWCAIWVRELCFGNWHYLEPIEGIEKIPASRWRLVCSVCKLRHGACIQCSNKNCFTAFHVSCAMKAGFQMSPLKTGSLAEMALGTEKLECFCDKHSPPIFDVKERILAVREEFSNSNTFAILNEEEMEHANNPLEDDISNIRSYPVAPMVYAHQLQTILQQLGIQNINTVRGVSTDICKYWALKREANGGSPLFEIANDKTYSYDLMTEQQINDTVSFSNILSLDLKRLEDLTSAVNMRTGTLVEKVRADRIVNDLLVDPDMCMLRNVVLKSFVGSDVFKTITYNLENLGYGSIIDDCRRCNFSSVVDFRQKVARTFQTIIDSDETTRTVRHAIEKAKDLVEKLTAGLGEGVLLSMLKKDFVLDDPANITERQWYCPLAMEEADLSDTEDLSVAEQRALDAVLLESESPSNKPQVAKRQAATRKAGTVKKQRRARRRGW